MSKHFTGAEIKEHVFGNNVLRVEGCGGRRWLETMMTTFETEDGHIYIAHWERGLTEGQDNEFSDQTLEEVFPLSKIKAKVKTVYSTDPSADTEFSLNKENLESATLISDGADAGLKAIHTFDTSAVLAFLKQADSAILGESERAFLEASRQFFTAVANIQKDL